ncbi:D-aminoacylase [Xylanimonas allomyrinae]|uniref:D-aminoacylase n=1 Tax=Xylanimonas allomyrinae TaxID=2509459 RepID=A0A4V0YE20_9MICO|nr:D-aminoacylase [Xylanimonas allomyrinae]QAY62681.1 D-aminoacylase [Xylanimonas allomyrinae]
MTRILITSATVVDGTEGPARTADVLVEDARIRAILPVGQHAPTPGTRVIDATGLVLAPGFIDMHAHSDLEILLDPTHPSRITQGITTEVLGQDGLSYAPVDDAVLTGVRTAIASWNTNPTDLDFSWRSVGEYLARLDQGIATNAAYLVPHGTLRAGIVGWDDTRATPGQIAHMQDVVAAAMEQGAVGLSAGLTYTPGMYADDDELVALCLTVAAHDGYFAPHQRSYGAGALDGYAAMIRVARRTGCPLHLTHATMNFGPNEGRAHELLAMVDRAVEDGVDITLDSYPYSVGATSLAAILPSWSTAGGTGATLARLGDSDALERIRHDLEVTGSDGCHGVPVDWDTIEISGVRNPDLDDVVGRRITDIAADQRTSPFDAFVAVLRDDDLATGILQHVGHEENVRAIMQHPRHMAGSDGLLAGAKPHPRAWGTFARYLGHYTRDLGLMSLEECVGHLTGRAARRLRLRDRGLVRNGYAADLVLFDPRTVADAASYADPRRPATGIEYVLVAGEVALDRGRLTGALAGRALRRRPIGTS